MAVVEREEAADDDAALFFGWRCGVRGGWGVACYILIVFGVLANLVHALSCAYRVLVEKCV